MSIAPILGLDIDWNEELNSKLCNKYKAWEKRIASYGGIWGALDDDLKYGLLLHKRRIRIIPKKYPYLRAAYCARAEAIQFELATRERLRKMAK